MSVSEWKKVNLFNVTPCTDFKNICQIKAGISSVCYNAKQKIFCDNAGCVHVFFRNWESISFQAANTAIQLSAVTNENNLLVILSREQVKNELLLQVFNLNKLNKRNGAPCMGTARLATSSTATALAACVADSRVYMAIGLQKGDILLHCGTLTRDMSTNFQCYVITNRPIVGIALQNSKQLVHMYICSDTGILLYPLSDTNAIIEKKIMLDSNMAPTRCCTLLHNAKEPYFVVGRDDALYCFTSDGRGPCYAFEGVKKHIAAYDNNLLVVVVVTTTGDQLIIIDTRNKMIVLSKQMEAIRSILLDNNECHVLNESIDIFTVRELNLHNKLRVLAEKNLYNVALRLVEGADGNESNAHAAASIYLKYGDNLLLKGELSGAVDKYVQTLGYIEPYTIIQKLMDWRHTNYLALYLQALVRSSHATPEHVQLLQSCNERLHLTKQLEYMYPGQLFNDLSTDEFDGITTELSLPKFLKALQDLEELKRLCETITESKIHEFLLEHGQVLLERQPAATVNALKMLAGKWAIVQQPERFLPFLMFNESCCLEFLEYVTEQNEQCNNSLYNLLFELHLRAWQRKPETEVSNKELLDFLQVRQENLNKDHAFVLCRIYSFWPGLIYLYNNYMQQGSSTQQVNSAAATKGGVQLLLQTLNKKEASPSQSSHLFGNLLNELLDVEQQQSILQLLRSLCSNKALLVSHVKDYFSQEHFQQNAGNLQLQRNTVEQLELKRQALQELLTQYSTQPIEFRSSICDICKQQLKLPAMYFLCQHSFHKECLSPYAQSEACVICLSNKKQTTIAIPELVSLEFEAEFVNKATDSYNDLLCRGIYEQAKTSLSMRQSTVDSAIKIIPTTATLSNLQLADGSQWYGRFPAIPTKPKSTNPFEDEQKEVVSKKRLEEYDNNLNPFND